MSFSWLGKLITKILERISVYSLSFTLVWLVFICLLSWRAGGSRGLQNRQYGSGLPSNSFDPSASTIYPHRTAAQLELPTAFTRTRANCHVYKPFWLSRVMVVRAFANLHLLLLPLPWIHSPISWDSFRAGERCYAVLSTFMDYYHYRWIHGMECFI